ncbi:MULTISPECIES: hypothetical protein [unclassified Mycobacterium]|uniref:hypothetical protein n=1 Tax=unclassified Mycobacterium TaxID=2642494 RepID=UPI0029C7939A|nr:MULTISPECIES: hypothetical protein [unclassified Mycobacterium]
MLQPIGWIPWVFFLPWILLLWLVCGLAGSHVAGLRRQNKLDGFKTGLLFGPIGVAVLTFKKERIPDIEVACPNCGTRQEVDGALQWFECWKCEERSDVSR